MRVNRAKYGIRLYRERRLARDQGIKRCQGKSDASNLIQKMTNKSQFSIRSGYRIFSATDSVAKRLRRLFANRIGSHSYVATFIESLEPLVTGLAFGIVILIYDALRKQMGAPLVFEEIVGTSINHAKPYALEFGLIFLGIYLVTLGSEISTLIRRLLVLPLFGLTHHALLFAVGVLWIYWGGVAFGRYADAVLSIGLVIKASVALLLVGEFGFIGRRCTTSKLVDRLGIRYQTARVLSSLFGVFVLVLSINALVQSSYQDAAQAGAEVHREQ